RVDGGRCEVALDERAAEREARLGRKVRGEQRALGRGSGLEPEAALEEPKARGGPSERAAHVEIVARPRSGPAQRAAGFDLAGEHRVDDEWAGRARKVAAGDRDAVSIRDRDRAGVEG